MISFCSDGSWPSQFRPVLETKVLKNCSRLLQLHVKALKPSVDMLCLCDQLALTERQPSSSSSTCSRQGWFTPKPEVYARHAISTLGVSNWTTGYWPHTLQVDVESANQSACFQHS